MITDPIDNELKTVCKINVNEDLKVEYELNSDLYNRHYDNVIREPGKLGRKNYFSQITSTQLLLSLCVNAYLVLHEKDILISKVEQKRDLKPGKGKQGKGKRSLFYRYKVTLPENYKPRKFNINYISASWQRSGHIAHIWTRVENAELISKRYNGDDWEKRIMFKTEHNGKVQVRIIRKSSEVHRKIGTPVEGTVSNKIYS